MYFNNLNLTKYMFKHFVFVKLKCGKSKPELATQ